MPQTEKENKKPDLKTIASDLKKNSDNLKLTYNGRQWTLSGTLKEDFKTAKQIKKGE